jgi:hypothetical protein
MDLFKKIKALLSSSFIEVDIDPVLNTKLISHGLVVSTPVRINLNHYQILMSVGLLESKRYKTDRPKFNDYVAAYTWIKNDGELKINKDIKSSNQRRNVEDFGVGVAIQLTKKFFKVDEDTISKIDETNKKTTDFSCLSCNGEIINVEAKGSTSLGGRRKQIKRGLEQKSTSSANIKIVSATLFNDNEISHCIYKDPPVIPPSNPEYKIKLMKADHYSRVFNLIGQGELSRYFELMKKRLMYDRDFYEIIEKDRLYKKLKDGSVEISYLNKSFIGNVYIIGKKQYQFIGFDKRLLSLEGFINFHDYHEESYVPSHENMFFTRTDGICIFYINNINALQDDLKRQINLKIENKELRHYQDYTTIRDIDMMRGKVSEQYFGYLFSKAKFKVKFGESVEYDLFISNNIRNYVVEIKIGNRINIDEIGRRSLLRKNVADKLVLITNRRVTKSKVVEFKERGLIIISRNELIRLIKTPAILNEIL